MSLVYQFVHVGKFLGVFQIHKSFTMKPFPIWVCLMGGKAFIYHDCTYWVGIVRVDTPQMCQSALGRQEHQVKDVRIYQPRLRIPLAHVKNPKIPLGTPKQWCSPILQKCFFLEMGESKLIGVFFSG